MAKKKQRRLNKSAPFIAFVWWMCALSKILVLEDVCATSHEQEQILRNSPLQVNSTLHTAFRAIVV